MLVCQCTIWETFETSSIEQPKIEDTLARANHELMHSVTPGLVTLSNGIDISIGGYDDGIGDILAIDEALREMTNIELRGRYWDGSQALHNVRLGSTVYIP